MTTDVRRAMEAVIAEHGEWNAYNFELADGVYTRSDPDTTKADFRVLEFLQVISDLSSKPLDQLRVLDLGSLEGLFSLELAAHGATTLGIEGRADSVARAQFVSDTLGLGDRVTWEVGDARDLDPDQHGRFDAILCLGLLYHLDGDDQLPFLRRLAECSQGVVIVDTQVSMRPKETLTAEGRTYHGRWYHEHDAEASSEQRMRATRSSLDNDRSFWLTYPSLVNALRDVGFTTVMRLPAYGEVAGKVDRVQVVAVRGEPRTARVQPNRADFDTCRLPERDERPVHKSQDPGFKARQRLSAVLPEPVRAQLRRLRGRIRGLRA